MKWFSLVIFSSFLWSICNHIDKFQVETFYKNTRVGSVMFLTSTISFLFALLIFITHPQLAHIDLRSAVVLLAAGVAYFMAAFPYLFALVKDEASRVVPLFQLQPILSFVLAYLFLSESLHGHQIVGGVLIMLGSIAVSLDLDDHYRLKKTAFFWMMASVVLFALNGLLFKLSARNVGYWSGVLYLDSGAALSGLVLFLSSRGYRRDFINVVSKNGWPVVAISAVNESLNLTARLVFNYATLLTSLALATVVGGSQPFFVLIIGTLITIWRPKWGEESLLRRHLLQKALAIVVTFAGTYILFT